MTSIGIDFGTQNSYVAHNGTIIENSFGSRALQSIVGFSPTSDEIFIGPAALNTYVGNAPNTISIFKILLGTGYKERWFKEFGSYYPFKIVHCDEHVCFELNYNKDSKIKYTPERLTAIIFNRLKQNAEEKLKTEISGAVIAFPSCFNYKQQQTVKRAAKEANLRVFQYISEPMAVAIAYGVSNKINESKNLLIYDLGAGTFDVSIVRVSQNKFEMLATRGDNHLGGENFTQRLVDCCIEHFSKENSGLNVRASPKSMRRLLAACEKAKKQLSITDSSKIEIEGLYQGVDFNYTFARKEFESLCRNLFKKTISITEEALKAVNITDIDEIDEIVLTGGSSRIPKIQKLMKKLSKGRSPSKAINSDEAIVYGTSILAENRANGSPKYEIIESLCYPIGISTTKKTTLYSDCKLPGELKLEVSKGSKTDIIAIFQETEIKENPQIELFKASCVEEAENYYICGIRCLESFEFSPMKKQIKEKNQNRDKGLLSQETVEKDFILKDKKTNIPSVDSLQPLET